MAEFEPSVPTPRWRRSSRSTNSVAKSTPDSWALENQNARFTRMALKSILAQMPWWGSVPSAGFEFSPEAIRLIIMAALVDVKDSRMEGPYKRDTVVDGIAYRAMFAQLMLEWETKCNNPSTSTRNHHPMR